jgi:hypothetical protein
MDKQRENGALLIAACIVAAIRLRSEPIQHASTLQKPKLLNAADRHGAPFPLADFSSCP